MIVSPTKPYSLIRIMIIPPLICQSGDVDQSLTLDYPEFCRLLRMERKIFAADAFGKFKTGFLSLAEAVEVLKLVK